MTRIAESTTALVREAADRLFAAADTVSLERARLVTEAYRIFDDQPVPLKRALAFRHVLQHMALDLEANPLFAGNTSPALRAWMLIPEYGFGEDVQLRYEHAELAGFLDGRVPPDLLEYWSGRSFGGCAGVGHLAVDLEMVVHHGLRSVLDQLERLQDGEPGQRVYREAMAVTLEAVIEWAHRYAAAAERAARAATDPRMAAAHAAVAQACRHVPERPARSLFEGLQAIALVHLAIHIEGHGLSVSIGLPDRVLAPFAEEAEADPEWAAALVAGFLLKISANSLQGRGSKTQAITIGGSGPDGGDRCNPVTRAFLRAYELVPVADPHAFLRWHAGLDRAVRDHAMRMLAEGRSMPLLVNDEPTMRGLMAAGVAPEDAADYCVIGCNELGIPGRLAHSAWSMAGGLNYLGLLNAVLLDADPRALGHTDRICERLESRMQREIGAAAERRPRIHQSMAERVPTPFTTALMRGAPARGRDLLLDMPYRCIGWFERGLVDAADALTAMEQLFLDGNGVSLDAIVHSMRQDHHDAGLRQRMLDAPKCGSGDEAPRRWLLWLLETRTRILRETEAELGLAPHTPCHVVRSLHHVDGATIGASPDGRRSGEPVGDSLAGAPHGQAPSPTSVLEFVSCIDSARHYAGGYNVNLTLPSGVRPGLLDGLAAAFFARGGQELQVNSLDPARLRAALCDPAAHRDIVVRVAGFSARFVELSPLEQAELIERAERAAARTPFAPEASYPVD